MRLLLRIALFCIVIGLLAGLLLRKRFNNPVLVFMLSLLPWLMHIFYVIISVWKISTTALAIFAGANLFIVLMLLLVLWRPLKHRKLWTAFIPTLQGFIYSLSLMWLVRSISLDGLGLNSLTWVSYAGATLLMSGFLLGYLFYLPAPKIGNLLKRRSK